jgi:hypothetical protein
MIRTLLASLALLSLTGAAHSDTPPSPTADARAALFHPVRSDSALLRSVTPADPATPPSPAARSARSARRAAIPKCARLDPAQKRPARRGRARIERIQPLSQQSRLGAQRRVRIAPSIAA